MSVISFVKASRDMQTPTVPTTCEMAIVKDDAGEM